MIEHKIKKVLIVDDDPISLKLLEGRLEENGFVTITKEDPTEALEIVIKDSVDLIILDVMMPIINGYNFCRLIKENEDKKHIPVILLTSRAQLTDIQTGLEMGAEAYITKPIDVNELIKTIRVLESSGAK